MPARQAVRFGVEQEFSLLFIVMLGGRHPAAKIEVHDVVFAGGENLNAVYPQLRQQWFGSAQGMHIDCWMEVHGVDQYQVSFSDQAPAPGEPRLFFINLGGYLPGLFGEEHRYLLVVAPDKISAKQIGKTRLEPAWQKPHTDNLWDLDDCIPIDNVDGRYIRLQPGPHNGIRQFADYIILS